MPEDRMADRPLLHGFFRSGASWRVRIALGLKGIAFDQAAHHLRRKEHKEPDFLALNPQGLVPALEIGGAVLTQSIAICEYLDDIQPEPALLPADPLERARVRAFALAIACDIHPLQNLGTLLRLRRLSLTEEQAHAWARDVIDEGLEACARLIERETGPHCFGNRVTLADICLIPQLANARRFGARADWPRFAEIEQACMALPAFAAATPENQPDAE